LSEEYVLLEESDVWWKKEKYDEYDMDENNG
jgi:hypothetical protein